MAYKSLMKKLLILLFTILISYSSLAQAKAMKCYTKNEVGEMSYGEKYIFERTNELDKSKPAILDFDELKIINADKIIVLNNGLVESEGTHSELIKQNGWYADAWKMQTVASDGIK